MIPTNIPENHRAMLRSVASKNTIAENELVRLYQAANDILTTGKTTATNIMPSKLVHAINPPECPGHRIEIATVTNFSGVFIQLSMECKKAACPILMTSGKKFSMEGVDATNSNIASRTF